jgi:hypothetical protein
MTLPFGASAGNRGTQRNLGLGDEGLQHRPFIAEDLFFSGTLQGEANGRGNVGWSFVVRIALAHDGHTVAEPKGVGNASAFVPLDYDLDLSGHVFSIMAKTGA